MEFLHTHPWFENEPSANEDHSHVVIDYEDWIWAKKMEQENKDLIHERDYDSYCFQHGGTGDGSRCIRCRDVQIAAMLAELKAVSDALGTNEGHSSVEHIKRLILERNNLRVVLEKSAQYPIK